MIIVLGYLVFALHSPLLATVGQDAGREAAHAVLLDWRNARSSLHASLQEELRNETKAYACPRASEFAGRVGTHLSVWAAHEQNRGMTFQGEVVSVKIRATATSSDVEVRLRFLISDGRSRVQEEVTFLLECPGDPGAAYEDADCNGRFETGIDTAVDVSSGSYTVTGPECLVIRSSVPPIGAGTISLTSQGGHISIDVGLTSTVGAVQIQSGGGDILVFDKSVSAQTDLQILSSGGDILLEGSTLVAGGMVELRSEGGDINVQGGVLSAGSLIRIQSGNGDIRAGGGTWTATGTQCEVDSGSGSLYIDDSDVTCGTFVSFKSGGILDSSGSRLTATTDYIRFQFGTGSGDPRVVRAASSDMNAGTDIFINSAGDIDVTSADLESNLPLTLDASDAANTIFVDGAQFRDDNNLANVEPPGVNVVGTPAFGGTE